MKTKTQNQKRGADLNRSRSQLDEHYPTGMLLLNLADTNYLLNLPCEELTAKMKRECIRMKKQITKALVKQIKKIKEIRELNNFCNFSVDDRGIMINSEEFLKSIGLDCTCYQMGMPRNFGCVRTDYSINEYQPDSYIFIERGRFDKQDLLLIDTLSEKCAELMNNDCRINE